MGAFGNLDETINRVLTSLQERDAPEMSPLLTNQEYQERSLAYLDSVNNLSLTIQGSIESLVRGRHVQLLVIALSVAGTLLIVTAVWFFVLRSIRRHISDRDKADEQLRRLSQAVEASQDGVQILDLEGRIVYSNRAVTSIYGCTSEECQGMHVSEMNADPAFARTVIYPAIEQTGRWSGEVIDRHKDGHEFPVWLTTSLVKDNDGRPVARVRVVSDITGIKETEQALRESEERYRLLFENMYEIAWAVDIPRGGSPLTSPVSFVSDRAEDIVGFAPDDFISDPEAWLNALHPDDIDAVKKSTESIIALKQPGVRSFRMRHRLNGDYVWLEEDVIPRLDDDGEVIGLDGFARDVTERKRWEELLMTIVEGVSGETGLPFFRSLVAQLRKALDADITFVGEINDDHSRVTTIAVNADRKPADNFEYELSGTPCENVVG